MLISLVQSKEIAQDILGKLRSPPSKSGKEVVLHER
jgi:hypothetical protein